MQPVVVGSSALAHFLKDAFRKPKDLDIYVHEDDWKRLDKPGLDDGVCKGAERYFLEDLEVKIIRHDWATPTDLFIMDEVNRNGRESVTTPAGEALVSPLDLSVAIKLASCEHGDPKHRRDVECLSSHVDLQRVANQYRELITDRKAEIAKRRIALEFFNKYTVPRWLEHDFLHVLVASHYFNAPPSFRRVVSGETIVNKEKFHKLDAEEKVQCVAEEAIVLALERCYIPELASGLRRSPEAIRPYSVYQLKRLSGSCGGLQDHPEWLAVWVRNAFDSIVQKIEQAVKVRPGFSERMEQFFYPILTGKAERIS